MAEPSPEYLRHLVDLLVAARTELGRPCEFHSQNPKDEFPDANIHDQETDTIAPVEHRRAIADIGKQIIEVNHACDIDEGVRRGLSRIADGLYLSLAYAEVPQDKQDKDDLIEALVSVGFEVSNSSREGYGKSLFTYRKKDQALFRPLGPWVNELEILPLDSGVRMGFSSPTYTPRHDGAEAAEIAIEEKASKLRGTSHRVILLLESHHATFPLEYLPIWHERQAERTDSPAQAFREVWIVDGSACWAKPLKT